MHCDLVLPMPARLQRAVYTEICCMTKAHGTFLSGARWVFIYLFVYLPLFFCFLFASAPAIVAAVAVVVWAGA